MSVVMSRDFTVKSGNDMKTLELIHKAEQQGFYAWLAAYGSFLNQKCESVVLRFSQKYFIKPQNATRSIRKEVKYEGNERKG